MAIVNQYEDNAGDNVYTTGVLYVSATTTNRLLFNDPPVPLTTTAYTTAIYYPTDGGHEGSGFGKVVFDNAHNNATAYIIDNDDRYAWATVLLSSTPAKQNGLVALTGITVTNAGAGYTSAPAVVINTNGVSVLSAFVGFANLNLTASLGVTSVTVTTKGLYVPAASLPTVSFVGGGATTQATGTAILSSGNLTFEPILSLSANGYGEAWGPTERRLKVLELI
jgi:hypothetical protein